jgi:Fe-S-cluster containining protein
MHEIVTTFPPTLRYKCDIDACRGCCSLFDEIEVSKEDVRRLKKLGYASFYEGKEKLLLKKPCVFSRGKLCEIHLRHGYAAKPEACKKYPFVVSVLDDDRVVVDVKWACRGVGHEQGDSLTMDYIKRELLTFVDPGRRISIGSFVPLSDEGETRISWYGVRELYDHASERVLFSELELREKITRLISLMRQFTKACAGSKKVSQGRVSGILRAVKPEKRGIDTSLQEQGLSYYGIIDELLSFELNPVLAAKKLGFKKLPSAPKEACFSRDAEGLYSLYLSQCLKETLSKPWSLRASFFWALGVMGYVDFVSRCIAGEEVKKEDMRAAIAIVDFLNKGLEEFRNYAYPRYPELGLAYLGFLQL